MDRPRNQPSARPFDADLYEREVLRPLRGAHGGLPPGNLMARYAIDADMNARQVMERLAEIRAWWRERAARPDSPAQVCRLFLLDDERLAAATGDIMNEPAWWREQVTGLRSVAPATERSHATATTPPRPARATTDQAHDWLWIARDKFWSAVAVLDQKPAEAPPEIPPNVTESSDRIRRAPAETTTAIEVTAIEADGDSCVVEVSWREAPSQEVQIHWSETAPGFRTGDVVPLTKPDEWGTRISGPLQTREGRHHLQDTVPTGYLIYVPFTVDDGRAVVGRQVALNTAAPVQHLRADRRGDAAILAWNWPADSTTALVEWIPSVGRPEHRTITLAEYAAEHGCVFLHARAGGTGVVRALCTIGTTIARSPPQSVQLEPEPVVVGYLLSRKWGRRSDYILTLTAEQDCTGVSGVVVVAAGRTMPTRPDQGAVVAEFGPLEVGPRDTPRIALKLPVSPARPGWIRCFPGEHTAFVFKDPPIAQMRVE